ncbi:MAG: type I-D CRISPR-associated endonuclease Cas1d [Heliobacteriaceae bacterium]|nr:type I-D CRISPR-associated endonuclease Cas1d [Heliobacteriaceae bacterium]
MSSLYITEQNATLRKTDERLVVTRDREVFLDVPLIKIDQIVILGNVTVTAATVAELMARKIHICFLSATGKYLGRYESPDSRNGLLRIAQHEKYRDEEQRLVVAKRIVSGKISNQVTFMVRNHRSFPREQVLEAIKTMKLAKKGLAQAKSLNEVRGYEGNAAAAYFKALPFILKNDFGFARRIRRPPTDPVNALLGLGYTLLTHNIQSAAAIVGLDPYIGFLHGDRYGRASLALDLVEEFRPVIVDSVVVSMINNNMVVEQDFEHDLGMVVMKDAARKDFFRKFEERKHASVTHPLFKYKVNYVRCFELQARILAKWITGEIPEYISFKSK